MAPLYHFQFPNNLGPTIKEEFPFLAQAEVVAHLLAAHAMDPLSVSDGDQMSALHWAALEGQTAAAAVLLEVAPALSALMDAKGRTAERIALAGNFSATASALAPRRA